jgi:hypothetical protein
VVVLAIAAVSSLVAPTAKAPGTNPTAPTVPNTPGPLTTPSAAPTPAPTPKSTVKPKKHKTVSAGLSSKTSTPPVLKRGPGSLLGDMAVGRIGESARRGALLAWFRTAGLTLGTAQLEVTNRVTGRTTTIGLADPYERPVWSHDGGVLLYARERAVASFPGTRWSLMKYDVRSRRSSQLASNRGFDLEPLGWRGSSALFSLATQPDTSLSIMRHGRSEHLSLLMPQIITQPRLSPNSRYVAFVAPTNCVSTCTLDIFDLSRLTVWVGPTGISNSSAFAWTDDSSAVVSVMKGRLGVTDAVRETTESAALPTDLPVRWQHQFAARRMHSLVRLVDTVTGATYRTRLPASR